jgi:hypothetical protein
MFVQREQKATHGVCSSRGAHLDSSQAASSKSGFNKAARIYVKKKKKLLGWVICSMLLLERGICSASDLHTLSCREVGQRMLLA